MKKFIFILALCAFGATFGCTTICLAQNNSSQTPSAIGQMKEVLETPPDLLSQTLRKAKELESESWAANHPDDSENDNGETFKNPFIPQTPKAPKVTTPVNPDSGRAQPEARTVLPIPQFTVSGLVWNSKKPAAIVNGQIVAIGDQVQNWAVAEITKEGVRVTYEDQALWVKPEINPNQSGQPNAMPQQPNKILRNYNR